MRADVLPEPELEFGGGNHHIDPKFGVTSYGPADLHLADAPRAIRVGLVGPADQSGASEAGWNDVGNRSPQRTSATHTFSLPFPAAISTAVYTPRSCSLTGTHAPLAGRPCERWPRSRGPRDSSLP